jgi:hypothetical protein
MGVTEMADFNVFNDKFSSLFRRRIEPDDGGQFWKEFVDKSDWSVLRTVLDMIADQKESERRNSGKLYVCAPALPEIKIDYFERLRELEKDKQRQLGTGGTCGICMGTGWIFCLFDEHRNAIDVSKPFRAPRFANPQPAACSCDRGHLWDTNASLQWRINNAKWGYPLEFPRSHPEFGKRGDIVVIELMKKNQQND